jgi:NADP-dependent 3-hydroxy acid dehydrogenase YdfG
MQIDGAVVAITGASGGMGEATARYLAERGAKVVLGARNEDRLCAIVEEITAIGGKATHHPADVRRREDVQALAQHAVAISAASMFSSPMRAPCRLAPLTTSRSTTGR